MKKYTIGTILLIMLLVTACVKNSNEDYTPQISISHLIKNPIVEKDSVWGKTKTDTLSLTQQQDDGSYLIQTVDINDTVFFAFAFTSLANELTHVGINVDTSVIELFTKIDLGTMAPAVTNPTELSTFQFNFVHGYNYGQVPVFYRTKKGGDRYKIELLVESDSKHSPQKMTLWQHVSNNLHTGE